MIHPFLEKYRPAIIDLCQKHQVKKLFVFGSITTEQFDEQSSDIDILIEFPEQLSPEQVSDNYFDLLFALEDLTQRKIDLLIKQPFRNPYFARSVDRSKQLLYAA